MNKKVVLAFSGGLDTTFCLVYLIEQGYEVYTALINTGGIDGEALENMRIRALSLGSIEHFTINAEEVYFENVIQYIIKFNALYQDDYPLMCTDRYVIAEEVVKLADKLNAGSVAHGCTNIGNDQVRFDSALSYLNNSLNIIKPIKELNITRDEEILYLKNHGIDIEFKYSKYSINQNILGCTISGSEIDKHLEPSDTAYQWSSNQPNESSTYLNVEFNSGVPVKLDSEELSGAEIMKKLNLIGKKYSIGKEIYTGDCIIGIKGRILFEAPGIFILMKAWKKLTQYTMTKQQISFFKFSSEKWGDLVYSGLYYEPLCRNLESMIDDSIKNITGIVKIKLIDNHIEIVEINSPKSLFNSDVAIYAQKSKWSCEETDGFIKLYTLQQNISGMR